MEKLVWEFSLYGEKHCTKNTESANIETAFDEKMSTRRGIICLLLLTVQQAIWYFLAFLFSSNMDNTILS